MAMHIELLADAIKTIGCSLPVGMEVCFWHDAGETPRMQIANPDGSNTEYAFAECRPLPAFPLAALIRESKLEKALRDLLGSIDLHTDVMDGHLDRSGIEADIEAAEQLLGEDWEVDETHPANRVTSVPASISYPMGSLGEALEVA